MAEISVSGRAERLVPADEATMHLGYAVHGPERSAVVEQAFDRHRALTKLAQSLIDSGRIDSYTAEEPHTYSQWAEVKGDRVTEFFSRVSFALVVTKLDEVGPLITELTRDGYDASVDWELSDELRKNTERELRALAVQDAQVAAEDYCEAIGMSVLTLRSLRDGSARGSVPLYARAMVGEADHIEVTVEDIHVSVSLDATYVAA